MALPQFKVRIGGQITDRIANELKAAHEITLTGRDAYGHDNAPSAVPGATVIVDAENGDHAIEIVKAVVGDGYTVALLGVVSVGAERDS